MGGVTQVGLPAVLAVVDEMPIPGMVVEPGTVLYSIIGVLLAIILLFLGLMARGKIVTESSQNKLVSQQDARIADLKERNTQLEKERDHWWDAHTELMTAQLTLSRTVADQTVIGRNMAHALASLPEVPSDG